MASGIAKGEANVAVAYGFSGPKHEWKEGRWLERRPTPNLGGTSNTRRTPPGQIYRKNTTYI